MAQYQLEHIAISVSDLDRAVAWYGRNFGFEQLAKGDKPGLRVRVALMRRGDRMLEIFEPYDPLPMPEGESGLHTSLQRLGAKHMALVVDDITAAYHQLSGNGVEMETEVVEGRTSEYFFCKDPDGILIEIIQRK